MTTIGSAFSVDQVAALALELLDAQETAAHGAREAERETHRDLVRQQVAAERGAADDAFAGTVVGAVTSVAGDVISVSAETRGEAASPSADSAAGAATESAAAATGRWANATRQAGTVFGAVFERAEKLDNARATELRAAASDSSGRAEDQGDAARRAERSADRMVEHIQRLSEARSQARLAATRG